MRLMVFLGFLATGCSGGDYEVVAQKRELTTSELTYDAGMVAVDTREPIYLYLSSIAQGEVTVFDVYVEDEEHWIVYDDWKNHDSDGDGIDDSQKIAGGGSEADPVYSDEVTVAFAPESEDEYRTVLTIISNDDQVAERDEDNRGIWRVVLRGIGRYPCASVYPDFFDFGPSAAGGTFYQDAYIQNCGVVTLTVSAFEVFDSAALYVDTPAPLYVLPGDTEDYSIAYEPTTSQEDASIGFVVNDPDFEETVTVYGNYCEDSNNYGWDDDGDGWFYCGGDCDDTDGNVSPSATEKANGKDDDCDGEIDEEANDRDADNDGDGWSETDGDCDDANDAISPDATDIPNQIDDDCDGRVDENSEWSDDDGDGMSEREGDCDDDDVLTYPGAEDTQDEKDNNCDGNIDEGTYTFDDDADGFTELDSPNDCNDDDPWTWPGATEDCDGRDNDCDGLIDEGEDDTEDGACAFVVDRIAPKTKESSCSTLAVAPAASALFLSMLGLVRRRR